VETHQSPRHHYPAQLLHDEQEMAEELNSILDVA
jgi:hypothetical protein